MSNKIRTAGNQQEQQENSRSNQENNNSKNTYFDPNNYNNDPSNMANYSGNYNTATYDTDYGEGTFPDTNAKEQEDNWVDNVGTKQQRRDIEADRSNQQQKNP